MESRPTWPCVPGFSPGSNVVGLCPRAGSRQPCTPFSDRVTFVPLCGLWTDRSLCVRPSVAGHLGHFHLLAIVSPAHMDTRGQSSCGHGLPVSGCTPGSAVELLGHSRLFCDISSLFPESGRPDWQSAEGSLFHLLLVLFRSDRGCSLGGTDEAVSVCARRTVGASTAWGGPCRPRSPGIW